MTYSRNVAYLAAGLALALVAGPGPATAVSAGAIPRVKFTGGLYVSQGSPRRATALQALQSATYGTVAVKDMPRGAVRAFYDELDAAIERKGAAYVVGAPTGLSVVSADLAGDQVMGVAPITEAVFIPFGGYGARRPARIPLGLRAAWRLDGALEGEDYQLASRVLNRYFDGLPGHIDHTDPVWNEEEMSGQVQASFRAFANATRLETPGWRAVYRGGSLIEMEYDNFHGTARLYLRWMEIQRRADGALRLRSRKGWDDDAAATRPVFATVAAGRKTVFVVRNPHWPRPQVYVLGSDLVLTEMTEFDDDDHRYRGPKRAATLRAQGPRRTVALPKGQEVMVMRDGSVFLAWKDSSGDERLSAYRDWNSDRWQLRRSF